MDHALLLVVFTSLLAGLATLLTLLRRLNGWYYETRLGERRFSLPPGDLGWPIIGNMWTFLKAFKSSDPDSFISSFVTRFNRTGIYKAFMFGSPTIIVTIPETCKQVLMDEEHFMSGWPESTLKLIGKKSFIGISPEEHKRLRRLTAAPVNGHEALCTYLEFIESAVVSALERWAKMDQIEFLTEVRRLTFRIITYIFLSSEGDPVIEALEREYTALNYGVRAMAINLPGFAYHRALKARKKLVAILQSAVTERRGKRLRNVPQLKKDMMDALIEVEDDSGRRLNDEEIIDILIMYLNAGHESSGHITMWATVFLQEHPEFYEKAKAEQEEIIRKRPPMQKGLTFDEVRQMEYLSKVIDETLRVINISLVVFREATSDVNINGYVIPKGWKVQVWFRSVHLDPEVYKDAKAFNPDRWDGHTPKAGSFIPFGAGSRLCPGNDLAKMEISVFLHYFLLGYQLKRLNPECPVRYLPHTRPTDNCLARLVKLSPPSMLTNKSQQL
ncbi:ent-kaurenoic acid oxidase 2-like [Magnolia sinica]|uniref:ent-kaurenoic acid oxidase 2-like n=1 Tax=Magnolia sinica TaxID=86752 RepID=UPI00265865B0|nr:ent-kaurenoic acid oxidase 2-like [Magnolia sinica]